MKSFIFCTALLITSFTQATTSQVDVSCAVPVIMMAEDSILELYPNGSKDPEIETPQFVDLGNNEFSFFTSGSLYLPGPYEGYAMMEWRGQVRVNKDLSCTIRSVEETELDIVD